MIIGGEIRWSIRKGCGRRARKHEDKRKIKESQLPRPKGVCMHSCRRADVEIQANADFDQADMLFNRCPLFTGQLLPRLQSQPSETFRLRDPPPHSMPETFTLTDERRSIEAQRNESSTDLLKDSFFVLNSHFRAWLGGGWKVKVGDKHTKRWLEVNIRDRTSGILLCGSALTRFLFGETLHWG